MIKTRIVVKNQEDFCAAIANINPEKEYINIENASNIFYSELISKNVDIIIEYSNNINLAFTNGNISTIICRYFCYNISLHGENITTTAYDNSKIKVFGGKAQAFNNSRIEAYDMTNIELHDSAVCFAYSSSIVYAFEGKKIIAEGMVRVILSAYSECEVFAFGSSMIVSNGLSSIKGYENSVIKIDSKGLINNISLHGRSHLIPLCESLEDFIATYDVKLDEQGRLILYKAVRINPNSDNYISNHDRNFVYKVGEFAIELNFNKNKYKECSSGLHASTLKYAVDYGKHWEDLVILEVRVNKEDLVVPIGTDGKIRAKKLFVERAIPPNEYAILL